MKTLIFLSAVCFSIPALGQKDSLNRHDAEGKKQGHWKHYETVEGTQVLTSEGTYLNNERTGTWTEYHSNGTPRRRVNYINGKINGPCITYFSNGNIHEKGTWITKWVGDYESYYSPGKLQHKFYYDEEGKKDGRQIYYFEDGTTAQLEYYSNKTEDSSVSYYHGGALKEKRVKDKYKVNFREDGTKKSESIYSGNARVDKRYYDNGNLSEEISYRNNKMDGNCVLYYKNGTPKYGCIYKDGKMSEIRLGLTEDGKLINGFHSTYRENGSLERAGKYINGKPDGEHRLYSSTGKLTMTVNFRNGKPDGELKRYDDNGKTYSTEIYKNGFFLSEIK
jgi:antitoxin component YwqK of YwqJK toxin-antitoxin module